MGFGRKIGRGGCIGRRNTTIEVASQASVYVLGGDHFSKQGEGSDTSHVGGTAAPDGARRHRLDSDYTTQHSAHSTRVCYLWELIKVRRTSRIVFFREAFGAWGW